MTLENEAKELELSAELNTLDAQDKAKERARDRHKDRLSERWRPPDFAARLATEGLDAVEQKLEQYNFDNLHRRVMMAVAQKKLENEKISQSH